MSDGFWSRSFTDHEKAIGQFGLNIARFCKHNLIKLPGNFVEAQITIFHGTFLADKSIQDADLFFQKGLDLTIIAKKIVEPSIKTFKIVTFPSWPKVVRSSSPRSQLLFSTQNRVKFARTKLHPLNDGPWARLSKQVLRSCLLGGKHEISLAWIEKWLW